MSRYFATKDRFVVQSHDDALILRRATKDQSWQEQFVFYDSEADYLLVRAPNDATKREVYCVNVQPRQLIYTYIKSISDNIEVVQDRKWLLDSTGKPVACSYVLSKRLVLGLMQDNLCYMNLPYQDEYKEFIDHPATVQNIYNNFSPTHVPRMQDDFSMPDAVYDSLQKSIWEMGLKDLRSSQLAFIRMMHGTTRFSFPRISKSTAQDEPQPFF